MSDFCIFTESLCKNMGMLPSKFKKFHLFFEELYARLYHWYMFEVKSLLVYTRDPYSKEYNSISMLYFFFRSGATLKVTYSPL